MKRSCLCLVLVFWAMPVHHSSDQLGLLAISLMIDRGIKLRRIVENDSQNLQLNRTPKLVAPCLPQLRVGGRLPVDGRSTGAIRTFHGGGWTRLTAETEVELGTGPIDNDPIAEQVAAIYLPDTEGL